MHLNPACLALCNSSETINFKASAVWNSLQIFFFFNFSKIGKDYVKEHENKMQIQQYNSLSISFQWRLFKNKCILLLCVFVIKLCHLPGALFAVAGWCKLGRVQSAQISVISGVLCGTGTVCHSLPVTFLSSRCPQDPPGLPQKSVFILSSIN